MAIELFKPSYLKVNGGIYMFRPTNLEIDHSPYTVSRCRIEGDLDSIRLSQTSPEFVRPVTKIERVIFNAPATIVIWSDKTKTVVKCQPGDTYDPEKGLALCISKKFLGNKGNFNEVFKKWIPESVEVIDDKDDDEIRVGSKVEVVSSGKLYSTYDKWVDENVKHGADRMKWKVGSWVDDGDIGHVKYIAPHGIYRNDLLAYVDFGTRCAIIGVKGLKKIK